MVFGVRSIHVAVQNLYILLKTTVAAVSTEILSKSMGAGGQLDSKVSV